MLTQNQKREKLVDSIRKFEHSNRTSDDYMGLFVAFFSIARQGDGLPWPIIKETIQEEIDDHRNDL